METISLKEEIEYRGFNPDQKIIIPTQNLIEIESTLDHIRLNKNPNKKETLRQAIKSSKDFYKRHFKLEKVPYIFEKNGSEYIKMIKPFKLPVIQNPNMDENQISFSGRLMEAILPDEIGNNVVYTKIELSNELSELSKIAYTHEIGHSQLNHIKGLIKEYYNSEVLSIFLELLHSMEERILDVHDSIRLKNLQDSIYVLGKTNDEDTLIEASLYTVSTLKAYELFYYYYFGSHRLKKEILGEIQRVFYQENTVEELLGNFDITYESSQNPKRIKKYLNR